MALREQNPPFPEMKKAASIHLHPEDDLFIIDTLGDLPPLDDQTQEYLFSSDRYEEEEEEGCYAAKTHDEDIYYIDTLGDLLPVEDQTTESLFPSQSLDHMEKEGGYAVGILDHYPIPIIDAIASSTSTLLDVSSKVESFLIKTKSPYTETNWSDKFDILSDTCSISSSEQSLETKSTFPQYRYF